MTESTRDQLIGFIGTGNIGNPMARQLTRGGYQLVVFDLRPEATENLLELGAEPASSAAEVASRCSIVFTSLPGPPQVDAATTGPDGILAGAQPGDIHVDLSTNAPTEVRRILRIESDAGINHIDAPVTGGVIRAGEGTLTVLGSGDMEIFERVRPLLNHIGEHVLYLGEAGMGGLYKLINNVIVLSGHMIVQEALVLGAKAGLDRVDLVEKLRQGTARPYMGLADIFLAKQWENPTSTTYIAEKDMSLALQLARDQQVSMPVASAVHQTYLATLAAGMGDLHHYSTLDLLEHVAGVEVPSIEPQDA
ncbi:MAG: NAD(P)-dependent oxidoreductase [Chloroflexi bacterium]|nr:NAD(P)-dependent oxidoreductase [Chloroflexota bacterium]MYD17661.1 NAD(P)-dependent oxidoreductase [Chloroflexota bacterium]MYJ01513.1 NAD(P)-dependent oxidoreductase [Chloroflexota bacterium]